jgi:AcrR family transcriptional regulator
MRVMEAAKSLAPRWRRRAAARPEEILEAALAEFVERGFDAARMEDIARRAGISKAAIYLYFPSKMAVLEALIEAKVAPLAKHAQTLAAAGQAAPLQALRALASVAAARLADPSTFAVPRLVIGLSGRFPKLAEYYRRNVVEKVRVALEALLEAAMADGSLRRVDKAAAVRAFVGPLMFEALWTHVLLGPSGFADAQTTVANHFDVLLNGLEARA